MGPGCDVLPYVKQGTDPGSVLCHTCEMAKEKEAKMAAKKKDKPKDWSGAVGASTAADGYVERARYQEPLLVKITPQDLQPKANELARVIAQRDAMKVNKREANAKFREQIAYFDERINELAESVREGSERRPVEVVERLNLRLNQVEVVRTDTGETISKRAATAEDRQETLPVGGKAKGAKKDAPANDGGDEVDDGEE
jgi:hypothetical protein